MTHAAHSNEDCRKMFAKLSEYLDGELDQATCREIQHHVRECVACEACFNTLKRTVELCREAESVPVPESFSLRLKEIVQSFLEKSTHPRP